MKPLFFFIALLTRFYSYEQTNLASDSLLDRVDTTELVFCGGVENDLPVGISDKFFRDTSGNTYIYVFYSQSTPLMMNQLMMEVQVDSNESTGNMQTFSVKPKWKYTFLKCYFPSTGVYRVILYNESKTILARGMVTIVDFER